MGEKKICNSETGKPECYLVKERPLSRKYGTAGKHSGGVHGTVWKLILDDITRDDSSLKLWRITPDVLLLVLVLRGQLSVLTLSVLFRWADNERWAPSFCKQSLSQGEPNLDMACNPALLMLSTSGYAASLT